MEHALYGD